MCNKIIRFFTTLTFSLVPFFLSAEQIETQISADTIIFDLVEILFADILVQYGNNKIVAKSLKFNQKTKELKFTEIQDLKMETLSVSASEAVISSDLSEELLVQPILYLIRQLRYKQAKYD